MFPQKFLLGLGFYPAPAREILWHSYSNRSAFAIELSGPEFAWFLAEQQEFSTAAHQQEVELDSLCWRCKRSKRVSLPSAGGHRLNLWENQFCHSCNDVLIYDPLSRVLFSVALSAVT